MGDSDREDGPRAGEPLRGPETTLEETLRAIVREELRPLREQLERALGAGNDELLTPVQAAELAKVRPATLRKWARTGALANRGSVRAPRYRRSEVLNMKIDAPDSNAGQD